MGAFSTGSPLLPSDYVSGTITISAGQDNVPQQLIKLIQAQLDPNCPGAARIAQLQADSVTLYVGSPSPLGGALSTTNYGYQLAPTGSNNYWTSFPGVSIPIGSIWVLISNSGAGGKFHVEVSQ